MKKVSFFTLQFQQYDRNPPEDVNLQRVLAGNKVFYTKADQFTNANLLNTLKVGDSVHIGAHRLNDGSYWMHWLHHKEKGALDPKIRSLYKPRIFLQLFASLLIFALMFYLFFISEYIFEYPIIVVVLLIIGLAAGPTLLFMSLNQLGTIANRRLHKLLKGLAEVERGDFSCCKDEDIEDSDLRVSPKFGLDSLQNHDLNQSEDLTVVTGVTKLARSETYSTGSMRNQQFFTRYSLSFGKTRYQLMPHRHMVIDDLNPIFFSNHPIFIAEKDPIRLIIKPENGDVLGLYNEKDQSAYLKSAGTIMTNRGLFNMYKVLFCIWLLMSIFPVIFWGFNVWHNGITPDKWDVLKLTDQLMFFSFFGLTIVCGLALLFEIMIFLRRHFSARVSHTALTRSMLIQMRQQDGQSPMINEVV